jgi:hypothetical protein
MPDPLVPAPPAPVSRRALVALALISTLAALLYALYWTPIGPDDPWITYRYAENIAAGHGWVYNVGERVMGNSTPLYTLVLAGAAVLGLPVPETSWAIGFVAMLVALVLVFLLVRRLYGEWAGVAAAGLLASAQLFHRVATYGMETPLYVVFILAAFLAYASGRELLAAGFAAACLLMRLDGAAVGAALVLVHVLVRREIPWKAAAVYVAIAAPWFVFSQWYFGSLVPNSMVAKRLHTQGHLMDWMARWLAKEPRSILALIGGYAALFTRPSRAALPVIVWGFMYAAAFGFGSIHRYDWYQTPLLAVIAAGAGIGLVWLAAKRPRAQLALGLALVGALALPDAWRAVSRARGNEGVLAIERLRHEAALWMRDSLPPGAPIAVGGIGMVGYYTRRHIFDAMGLVTPQSMRIDYELPNPRIVPFPRFLPAVIQDFQPEFVFDAFWLPAGQDLPTFMQGDYTVVKQWRGANPRWPRFILYRRIAPVAASTGLPE